MMGGKSGGCRGENYRAGQIGEKWGRVTSKQKEGKRNRIKVIGDVKERKRATNIPSKPASVTNAIRGATENRRSTLWMTPGT